MQAYPTQVPDADDQRRCIRCGYSLRGLLAGASCPECGFKVHSVASNDAPLDQAPKEIVYGVAWRFALACTLVVIVMPALAIAVALLSNHWGLGFLVSLAVVAPIASWLLTKGWQDPSAIFNDLGSASRVRRLVRFGGPAWVLAGGVSVWLWLYGNTTNPTTTMLKIVGDTVVVIGLAQVVLLGVLMERMARWMRDDGGKTGAGFLVFGAAVVLLGTVIGAIIKVVYNPAAPLLQSVSMVLVLAVLLVAALLIARFTRNAVLAVVHMHHNLAADERMAENKAEHEQEMVDRSIGADEGGESKHR